ncbi:putative MFS family arabinose efflux permease [Desulfobotulus alkaliphilus]|uniref:Putative MFS family arabinose efflux permease n=1 Tax=Desulfobotulus alkaliphilus TaxID=622671 RepID=A0A562RII7_9BACT|nr:MFS transporter [Desulfobotulus alkaliphilus]TWI68912.1 putative MFS family arabinose efflux permease [Desulfobotulus alkaliphilus]
MRKNQSIIILSIIILFFSLSFMVVLVSNSFEKIFVSSELAGYAVPQKDFKRKIEAALRFGKSLDNLIGIEKEMAGYAAMYHTLSNIEIYDLHHNQIYSISPLSESHPASTKIQGKRIESPDPSMQILETSDAYLIILPLNGPAETWTGTAATTGSMAGNLVFSFHKHEIKAEVRDFWGKRMILGAIIATLAGGFLFILLARIPELNGKDLHKIIFFRVLTVIVLTQAAFAGISVYQFHRDHVQLNKEKIQAQLHLLKSTMERILASGIALDRISRMDDYLMEVIETNPEIDSLKILDNAGNIQAYASKHVLQDISSQENGKLQEDLWVTVPLIRTSDNSVLGEIRAVLDKSSMRKLIRKLLLDSLTIALIASLLIVEQIYFMISHIRRKKRNPSKPHTDQDVLDNLMLARFAAFLFLLAFAMPVSFVPLQMLELYTPIPGLPKNIILGLPISLEMLCALGASLLAGAMADRLDWRTPFVCGILMTSTGLFFSAMADNGITFILARGVCGLGYGLSWMALQSFLFTNCSPTTRARGSSHFVAGIFSGHICGTALGAILAERTGYPPVFLVGMLVALASLVFFLVFMRNFKGQATPLPSEVAVSGTSLLSFISDRNVFALIFFCIIPFSICQVGLLFFATPLYLNGLGMSQSDIGRVLMIYGLSVVYLAPQISKIVDSRENKKPFIVAGGLLGGLGLSLLYIHQGFLVIVIAIFLLGLASSIGSSAQTAFALKLKSTEEFGMGKAMAIQRAADKLGQMLGPLALGALMSGVSISQGLVVLGFGYMLLSILFLFMAKEDLQDKR